MEPNSPPNAPWQPPTIGLPAEEKDPPRAPRSARRQSILLLVGGLALAAATAAAAIYGSTAWRIMQQRNTTLSTPAEVGGLRLDDSTEAKETADYLRVALAAGLPLDDTVGAIYLDAAAPLKSVIIIGGTAILRTPERDLDQAFRLLSEESGRVEGVSRVPAGDLGGVMKCGASPSTEADMVICGWADHGSLAIGIFPDRSVAESAELLRALRSSVQHRN